MFFIFTQLCHICQFKVIWQCQKYMHFRDACQPLTMVRNCYFYTEYYLMLNLLNNINIIKMFHSHIKMYRTLVIWKYASVYIRCLDIVTIVYRYIYHFVYITVIVLYFPFTFCTNNMALYIMVLYAIVYYGTTWYMQSFIYFFLYFFLIFILQCPIMPYKQYASVLLHYYLLV